MAKVSANYALDIINLDLNLLVRAQTSSFFYDNANIVYNGIPYQDVAFFQYYSGGSFAGSFGGYGVSVNGNGQVTGGTLTGYIEQVWNSYQWVNTFAIESFSYPAVSLADAANTITNVDDLAAIAMILSGDDLINLSNFNDVMIGYGGNDRIYANSGHDIVFGDAGHDSIYGGYGDDWLEGGSGNDLLGGGFGNDFLSGGIDGRDTAQFNGSSSSYSVHVAGTSITVNSQLEGIDTLTGIELIQFSDVTLSLAQFAGRQDPDAVFRFYDTGTASYFYSGSIAESDNLIRTHDTMVYEGIAFDQNRSGSVDTIDVLRFFNSQTGTYFYTGDQQEANNIFQNFPHFKFEGLAYQAHSENLYGTTELFRFLNTDTGTHLYTADHNEFQSIVQNYSDTFKYEGIAYFVDIA